MIQCTFINCKTSIDNNAKEYIYGNIKLIDPLLFISNFKNEICNRIREQKWENMKIQLTLNVKFYKNIPNDIKYITAWFNSGMMSSLSKSCINDEELKRLINEIVEKVNVFTSQGSGWIINDLLEFKIKLIEYKPLKASSYMELPEQFRNSKYKLINVKNNDNECFKWCISRYFCLDQKNPERISERLKEEAAKINWNNLNFPMTINDIDKFERQNSKISVSLYSFNTNDLNKLEICPLRISKLKNDVHIMLLLISNEETNHYVLMKDLSPFVNKNWKRKTYICKYCLHSYCKKELLEQHEPECSIHTPVKLHFVDEPLCFKNYIKTIKHPFVIYADFESSLKKVSNCQPNPEGSYTMNIQKHLPNSFCAKTVCEVDEYSKTETYIGMDAAAKFVEHLQSETKRIYNLLKTNESMRLNQTDKLKHYDAKECYICKKEFTIENYKVRDHNHLTGKYRGPAHLKCNLIARNPKFIPVMMHNLSNYDSHLFIKEFGCVQGNLSAIPETDEKYISFSQNIKVDEYIDKKTGETRNVSRTLRFIDSFRFLPASLEKLSSNLETNQLINLSKHYPNETEFKLLTKKGIYPYEWIDHINKLKSRTIPKKEDFYSKLNDQHISDEEYQRVIQVWNTFNCKTFRDYHEIYLKLDTILLSDVFENFRNTCMVIYNLDPAHYFTSPGLSFDALLKYTNIELESIQDPDILLFVEKGIRGGISTITHRYAKANNPYIDKSYNKKLLRCK